VLPSKREKQTDEADLMMSFEALTYPMEFVLVETLIEWVVSD